MGLVAEIGHAVGGFRCLNGAEWTPLRAETCPQIGGGSGAEIAAKTSDAVQFDDHKSQVTLFTYVMSLSLHIVYRFTYIGTNS